MHTVNEIINILDAELRTSGPGREYSNYQFTNNGSMLTLVAHIDTVCPPVGKVIHKKGKLYRHQSILGADDRAGCFVLDYLQKMDDKRFNYLYTDREESGGYGAKAFAYNNIGNADNKTQLYIEIDRHGTGHYATYEPISASLELYLASRLSLVKARGSYSDIADISEILGVPSINLACGYYLEHTNNEYLVISELLKIFDILEVLATELTPDIIGTIPIDRPEQHYNSSLDYMDDGYEDYLGMSNTKKGGIKEYLDGDYEEYEKWYNTLSAKGDESWIA